MNKDYIEFATTNKTKFSRPPQVKPSKAQIYTKFYKIPEVSFEERQLTSFVGAFIFQIFCHQRFAAGAISKTDHGF